MGSAELLKRLWDGGGGTLNAVRAVTRLQPAGGAGDKVFPPTYEGAQYATEKRRIDGQPVDAVLLDSVQSQANRMEQVLLQACRRGECSLPLLQVTVPRIVGDTVVTGLDAPHRVFDAIFRDSLLDGVKFRESPLGTRLVKARIEDATALFEACPTGLLFGMWDSTSGEGGVHGARFPRAIVSEIVGLNITPGRRTSSRIDPLGITRTAAVIYRSEGDMWTLDEAKAVRDKKAAVKYESGRPSEINHGNIAPSIGKEGEAGGVTISEAVQTTVLSFPQLRRLRFPDPATGDSTPERDAAARATLAALALYAVALQREEGYFLRSRCHLIPVEPPACQFIGVTAKDVESCELTVEAARKAFETALARSKEAGLPWRSGVIELTPTDKLVELVRRSDEKVKTTGGDADVRS
jgi:CRISPR-associated protein Csb1